MKLVVLALMFAFVGCSSPIIEAVKVEPTPAPSVAPSPASKVAPKKAKKVKKKSSEKQPEVKKDGKASGMLEWFMDDEEEC